MNNCKYPNCERCKYVDCIKTEQEVTTMKETMRKRIYRENIRALLPNCDNCHHCSKIKDCNGSGVRRLCNHDMRLIENRITTSPSWCPLQ